MSHSLLLYLSHDGQTRKITEFLAAQMRQAGRQVVVAALADANGQMLAAASQVVIGAAVRYGRLPQALYAFVGQHQALLAARANAFFCVNLTARKPGKDTPQGSVYMRKFLQRSAWQPQQQAVFAGALQYSRYRWYDREIIRLIMRLTNGPTDPREDIELTDWQKVSAFAQQLLASAPSFTPEAR